MPRTSSVGHALADPVAGTDAATRRVGSARADTIAGTDARSSASAKALADTVAGTDARARVWAAKLTIADGITADDDVQGREVRARRKQNVDDSATVTDCDLRSDQGGRSATRSPPPTRSATQADYARQPADALVATDVLARAWAIFEAQDDALRSPTPSMRGYHRRAGRPPPMKTGPPTPTRTGKRKPTTAGSCQQKADGDGGTVYLKRRSRRPPSPAERLARRRRRRASGRRRRVRLGPRPHRADAQLRDRRRDPDGRLGHRRAAASRGPGRGGLVGRRSPTGPTSRAIRPRFTTTAC